MRFEVPFKAEHTCFKEDELYHPVLFSAAESFDLERVGADPIEFYKRELSVGKLNAIHEHLWFAGLERPARPLHQQACIGRKIRVIEVADLHMLWKDDELYLKPLPDFLLSFTAWKETITNDEHLYELACGFLLSWMWLIRYPIDLKLAHEYGLISSSVHWKAWVTFISSAIDCPTDSVDFRKLHHVNIRYRYSELRLHRVNLIYRLCSNTGGMAALFRGYHYQHQQYTSFLRAKLSFLVGVGAYMALALGAFQVGLGTTRLGQNEGFNRAASGFTIFAIIMPIGLAALIIVVMVALIWFNAQFTLKKRKKWSETKALPSSHSKPKTRVPNV